jgi:hypothetical protein
MNPQIPTSRLDQIEPEQEDRGATYVPAAVLDCRASAATAAASEPGGETDARLPHASLAGCGSCADTLHELANTISAVLIHAQVMEWRLPPYSRLKRPVREIERQAQRSAALLKRLLRQHNHKEEAFERLCGQVPPLHGTPTAVTARAPEAIAEEPEKLPFPVRSPVALVPVFSRKRTHKVM